MEVKVSFTAKIISPELKSDIKTVVLFFLMHETCSCTWKKPHNTLYDCFKEKEN